MMASMVRRVNDSGVYQPQGTVHFNVKYKESGFDNRVLARDLKGYRPSDIEWVWIVEEKRTATAEEIRQLCSGKWKGL